MSTGAPTTVVDVLDREWPIDRPIGDGGQGTVYSIVGGRYAVKILHSASTSAAVTANQLDMVRRMNLKGLPVATPLERLAGDQITGYLMRLAGGMLPLGDLLPRARDVPDVKAWYLDGGGLQRRLRVLARLADVIKVLHGRGIVYSDLSPANVLVSKDLDQDQVMLIDLDNLRYADRAGAAIGTPGFRAPEIERALAARARGVSASATTDMQTDAHSLAVLIFSILTLADPLLSGVWVDPDADRELAAKCGHVPWVAHPDDRRNAQCHGIPPEMVMTGGLFALARATFEAGLLDPTARPTVGEWARELRSAAGSCVRCPSCHQTSFPREAACSWCGAERPRIAQVVIDARDERGEPTMVPARRLSVALGDMTEIRRAEAFGDPALATKDNRVATVRVDMGRVLYTADVRGTTVVAGAEERAVEPGRPVDLAMPATSGVGDWAIRFGERGRLHRIATVEIDAATELA